MSRHQDDGGNQTTSDDGDDEGINEDSSSEFRDWVDEAAEGADPEEDTTAGGWISKVFGRDRDESVEESEDASDDYDSRLGSDPDSLSVFSAVQLEEEDEDWPDEDTSDLVGDGDVVGEDDDDVVDDDWSSEEVMAVGLDEDDDDGLVAEEPVVLEFDYADEEVDTDVADVNDDLGATDGEEVEALDDPDGESSDATFADLWSGDDDDDAADDDALDDVIDFASFTSEDYVQATTREYVGLAEAVARAEEEDTERIAVSAEIPGLESGIVGLEDVVGAAGEEATGATVEHPSGSDLSMRVLTAVGLVVLFAASLLSPYGIGALIVVVLGIAAGEMYAALIRAGYRPLSIFGFAGIAGAFFGTWISGPIAIPISLLLCTIAVFLFYATVPGRRAVLENATLTLLVMAWIGGLGGLAFDLLGSDDYQWLVLGLVLTVAAMDIAQYFVGRRIGRHQLAPQISPKKTIEGYIGGVVVALGVGAAFGLATPFDVTDGLIIGAVVAVVAPLGDLAVSVLKRALGVKDMGYILPGHGGVLDRVDAMIMTIPALWLTYSWMGLVN